MVSTLYFPKCSFVVLIFFFFPHGSGAQMPPRPSSVQSDGSLHPAMSQSPMAQDRGTFKSEPKSDERFKKVSHALPLVVVLLLFFSAPPQGLCREIRRCLLMAPLSLPLLCPHVSPQGDRCILGWAHISRTTPWVATDSRGDNTALKVLSHCPLL